MTNMTTTPMPLQRPRELADCTCEIWADPKTGRAVPHTHIELDRPMSDLPWENR